MKNSICPLIEKKCKEHGCSWYVQVKTKDGQNPFSCAMSLLPILSIKEINEIRKTTSAVESFRDEILKGQDRLVKDKQDHNLLPFKGNDPHQAGIRDPKRWPPRDYSIQSKKWNDDPAELASVAAAVKEERRKAKAQGLRINIQEEIEKHTKKHTTKLIDEN